MTSFKKIFIAATIILFLIGAIGLLRLPKEKQEAWIKDYTKRAGKNSWWLLPIAIINRGFITIIIMRNP